VLLHSIFECTTSDAGHTAWDVDGGEVSATIERIIANALQAVRERDGGEVAGCERTATYRRNTGRYGIASCGRSRHVSKQRCIIKGRGEGVATYERTTSNALQAVWEGDGGEVRAIIVFASFFISTTYTLKGRKVKSKNLQLIIKSKI